GDTPEAVSLRRVELVVNPDGTFSLKKGFFPVSGNFLFGGETSRLVVQKVLDIPLESQPPEVIEGYKDLKVEWQKDGTIKLIDKHDFNRDSVVLTKLEEE